MCRWEVVGRRGDTDVTWRGWVHADRSSDRSVTSTRLAGSAQPRNRLFPKTRSWLSLNAPLELLSPLSVVRFLFALATVIWPVLVWAQRPRPAAVGVCALTSVIWIALLTVRAVDRGVSRWLALYWTVAVAVLVWSGHGWSSVAPVLFLVPMFIFLGLFFSTRAVVVQLAAAAVALSMALAPSAGPGQAVVESVVGVLALSFAPLATVFLRRAASSHGSVDPDTGLPNGFGLTRMVAQHPDRPHLVVAVVLAGISTAREALGYPVGTELVRRVVENLGQILPSDAVIGRVEGDELIVIVPVEEEDGPTGGSDGDGGAVAPAGRAERVADSLVKAVNAGHYLVGDIEVSLRAHIGLVGEPDVGGDLAELIRRASLSARRAASRGLTLSAWDGDQEAMTADDLGLLADLGTALEGGGLALAYQPQIAPSSGQVRAVEALLRWEIPGRGPISPAVFIPLAERTGLVDRLTRWVVAEALDAQGRWRAGGWDVPVSVNVSAKNLADPDLPYWILDQLAVRRLPPSCLTVEVTETAVTDIGQARQVLGPLHAQGVRISIDDFGTGFTSLAALPRLPLDELKVDQSFVLASATSSADDAIVCAIGELAHRLGLEVVAEGVETEATGSRLGRLGFDLLQGYHYARPMDERSLLVYLGDPPLRHEHQDRRQKKAPVIG